MVRFHRYRKQGQPTARALQEAKLALMREESGRYRQPYYWAAFQVIGGRSNY
jgi:CHAT domain-containing protein